MVRTREYLRRFYSDETIDDEIEQVKSAKFGECVFYLLEGESDDYIMTVLALAGVSYEQEESDGMIFFYKVQPEAE